jgi:hypothetical protein
MIVTECGGAEAIERDLLRFPLLRERLNDLADETRKAELQLGSVLALDDVIAREAVYHQPVSGTRRIVPNLACLPGR